MVRGGVVFILALGLVIGVFVLANFASAAVVVVSPANFTNQSGSIMINISYVNVTDITSPLAANTTFYYNNTAITVNNFSCDVNKCNATWVTTGVPDNRSAVFSVILGNDTLLKVSDANSSNVLVDNAPPVVFNNNISSPVASANRTGTLVINVTVIDITANIRAVLFNITNSTGIQNATYMGTREGTTDRYSVSVNTAHFPDGWYNITVIANDTTIGGNRNNSAAAITVAFDQTAPTVSLTCTPNPVTKDETLTCSCAASDTVSGVNNTAAPAANPSTVNTGTFSAQCSSADRAGNSASSSVTYTVSSSSGGTSVGGGGGGSSSSSSAGESKSSIIISKVTSQQPYEVKSFVNQGVKEIEISVSEATNDIRLTVTKYNTKPSGVSAEKSGKVYSYVQIEATSLRSNLNKAIVTFKVEKSWALSNGISKEDISVSRFSEGEWKELSTIFKEEDTNNYYYDVELSSFSYFAIAGKTRPAEVEETSATDEPKLIPPEEASGGIGWKMWALIGAIILIAAGIGFYFMKKR